MGAELPVFTQEEMAIDEIQGFPKAYALLCRTSATNGPFAHGPPLRFIPYVLKPREALRVKELDQLFPIIHPEVRCTSNLSSYANILWEQLDHIGNAGFEPALFRVDCFGNVVYRHADSASPLAWDIDHWFPISRGGKTVPSNLRILQWQACKKKKNKLDFIIPWWDLQLGISVNQFLSIFSSTNSDFRSRAFSFLFPHGGGEEHESVRHLHLHSFPRKFMDAKRKKGSAPAAIVLSKNSSEAMVLKAVDPNRSLGQNSPFPASMKSFQKEEDVASQEPQTLRSSITKEKSQSARDNHENNPYLTISRARDSLRQRKEAKKQQPEISQVDEELNELQEQNNIEQIALQELETVLMWRRRRVEKCRRLSEAQASYRLLLEKMIRDAMHQTVVYKEELRLNQAASSALIARLVAQKAACDSAENELRRKHKQREELMLQAMACSDQAPEISQIYDDFHENSGHLSSIKRARRKTKKELRAFLEEEQKAFDAGISLSFDKLEEPEEDNLDETTSMVHEEEAHYQPSKVNEIKDDNPPNSKLKGFQIGDESYRRIDDQKKQLSHTYSSSYKAEEGNGTNLISNDQDTTVKKMLKQNQRRELNFIKPTLWFRRINDKKKLATNHCVSSCNVDGHDGVLVSNKLKQVQKRKLHAININESQKQQNLHLCSREKQEDNEEYKNQVGKENVEKWLQILLENAEGGSPFPDSHPTPRNFDEIANNTNAEIKPNEIELCTINNAKPYFDKMY